ncbi:hypothetical protein VB712_10925 [Spirulina sp. CCNP1310]|uniref:hypothetical protein n=1 Tax=Spirulina sp. CCNP1310 TaxID=3110249 RepID=UPI002B1F148A|nr:hypothetical protein [Spirulina sp. CCNP1310]MEA5419736.1 hypothetical protein [Spirulina sp. CCNP1310]
MAELNKQDMRDRLGNVEQIREILFGTQLRDYEQRIEKLEADSAAMNQELRDRLDQMQSTLSGELKGIADSLEKKLKYLSLTTHDETTKLWQKLEQTSQKNYNILETLNKTFTSKTASLREELTQTQEQFQTESQTLKVKIFEELEKCFSTLRDAKVSRVDLAEVLFELCIKVKGTEFVPDLKEAMENHLQTDFLLPEEERPPIKQTSQSSGIM